MAFLMNEYEIDDAVNRLNLHSADLPNLYRAALTLKRLCNWTNRNSDGWPYWSKPSDASRNLQEVLHDKVGELRYADEPTDLTDAELRKLFTPIRSFLARQANASAVSTLVNPDEVFLTDREFTRECLFGLRDDEIVDLLAYGTDASDEYREVLTEVAIIRGLHEPEPPVAGKLNDDGLWESDYCSVEYSLTANHYEVQAHDVANPDAVCPIKRTSSLEEANTLAAQLSNVMMRWHLDKP